MRILFTFMAFVMISGSVFADEKAWNKLTDGRVVIEVYGQRLAFDPADESVVDDGSGAYSVAHFWDGVHADPTSYLTIAEAIRDRGKAEIFFQKVKSEARSVKQVLLVIRMLKPNSTPDTEFDGQFLKKFNYDDVSGVKEITFSISAETQKDTLLHKCLPVSVDADLDIKLGPDDLGILTYVSSKDKGNSRTGIGPNKAIYILSKHLRLSSAQCDLQINFDSLSYFNFFLTMNDSVVQMNYKWLDGDWLFTSPNLDSTGKYFLAHVSRFQKKDWPRIDDAARQIAAHIFIDRTVGDFQ